MADCRFGQACPEHGFIHGAEAEELRAGVEKLAARGRKVSVDELRRLLDRVDARDSLAFLECKDAGDADG